MKKTTEQKAKELIIKKGYALYQKHGTHGLLDFINEYNDKSDTTYPIPYEHCKGCEDLMPAWEHNCIACGQNTTPEKPKFFQAVLKPVKDVMKHVYPYDKTITIEERLGDACCPDCMGNEWMLLAPEQVAVKQGGKVYIECLGCGYVTHL
jgi:hypothetical protein